MLTGKELAKIVNFAGPKDRKVMMELKERVGPGLALNNPVVVDEAKGSVLKDLDGNIFVDLIAGIGVLNLGHRPDSVVEAVKKQLGKAIHTHMNFSPFESYCNAAEAITSVAPFGEKMKVNFFNTGAEAVENAVKAARIFTKRSGIIVFDNSFHGRSLLTAAMTHKHVFKDGWGPQPAGIYRMPSYYYYRDGSGLTEEKYLELLLRRIEDKLCTELDPTDIACMVIEPIQGEGGILPQPPGFLRGLKALCEKYGILYVSDEVQAGFCRSGKWFAVEYAGFAPDLMTIAKSMACGMPISGVMGKVEIMDTLKPNTFGGTYSGNPLSCAATAAAVETYKKMNACSRAVELGTYMKKRLNESQKKHREIADVRGVGAMMAYEVVKDPETREADSEKCAEIIREALKRGLLLMECGVRSNGVRLLPALVITDEQLAQAFDIMDEVFDVVF